jgi:UDP-N-acetylmuramoyl-L-alanyl-D-glutamate--2,6-diaminopimelate ligase
MAIVALRDSAEAIHWLNSLQPAGLSSDTRQIAAGEVFVAWPGAATDGRLHLAQAFAAGARAALVEAEGIEGFDLDPTWDVATLSHLRMALGGVASAFMGHPSRRLSVVAVTGTNGKTSSAWWIAQALSQLGKRSGLIGTLGIGEPPLVGAARQYGGARPLATTGLTTPGPIAVHHGLHGMLHDGYAACAMEASSIGIEEHRLAGTHIEVAVFTNFTQDHLDYHGSMQAYWEAKAKLFDWPGLRAAVINIDDERGAALAAKLQGGGLDVWTVSVRGEARLVAHGVSYVDGGLAFDVSEGGQRVEVRTGLIGSYNAANLLGVLGALRVMGASLPRAAQVCAALTPVPGRMQRVVVHGGGGFSAPYPNLYPEVVVDYAHTPDALEKALEALLPLANSRGGQLWCVFGCGGDRDRAKRPQMGGIAERLAQKVVLTSDNPRSEDPQDILSQIAAGLKSPAKAWVLADRAQAIAQTLAQADSADVVLIAGKGHEDYQEVAGVKKPFSDVDQAAHALRLRLMRPGVGR